MKKLILRSVAFQIFIVSFAFCQTSCEKDAKASPNEILVEELVQLNKIVYTKRFWFGDPIQFIYELWISNYDGTGQYMLNPSLPSGYEIQLEGHDPHLSPDGKFVFFTTRNMLGICSIWKCNLDGSNSQKIIDGEPNAYFFVNGAY